MKGAKGKLVLTRQVNQLLLSSELPATLTIEKCAAELAMSMTSFRRKLADEEATYKQIQQKFLNEFCVQALLTEHANIDLLAIKLGYSERATFERAFRHKFGVTPSQFRELSMLNNPESSSKKLTEIAQNLPPMPDSCQQLLQQDSDNLEIQSVLDIVRKDAIFSGRIIGQASKAIYGKTPKDLQEAIGRNLGINTVVNFAVLYAMQDALQKYVPANIIAQYSQAFMLAPKLFQLLRRLLPTDVTFDIAKTEQVLVFSLLGIFLLSHKEADKHELMLHSLQGIDDIDVLNRQVERTMGLSIYRASALMLSLWHIDASLIKALTKLDKLTQPDVKKNPQIVLIQFTLSCLFMCAKGADDYSVLIEKAAQLQIEDFSPIGELLSTAYI